ncbi:MAG: glycosyltransferase family 39 protein, partial [Oscillospiraceae bacterium]|nr:glycosyltransferase family 39 protein [Oscillospiraceae bacterium]
MKFRAILDDKRDDWEEDEELKPKPWLETALFFLLWTVVIALLAIIYTEKSKYIYFWDDANYWDKARQIASGAISDGFWHNVYSSIGNMDYNYVAGLLSAVFAYFFGGSRTVYIVSLVLTGFLPAMAAMYFLAKKLGGSPKLTVVLIIFICPVIVCLTFLGFADITGLSMCLLCYNLYFTREEQKQSIWKSIIIGALLVLMMIWRRWYAFFAVSFITAMIADSILFKKKWYCVAAVILTAAAIILLFFRDFLMNILIADYGDIYSGYKYNISVDFKLITRYFGILFLLFTAVCSVLLIVKKKEYRPIMLWIQIIGCAAMFMATQTHGQQHLLLYVPSLSALLMLIIKYAEEIWMKIGICVLAALNAVNVCIPREQPENIQDIAYYAVIPDFSMAPRTRDDIYMILSLKTTLDGVIGEGEKMGVLASSFKLNEDILKNVEPSLNISGERSEYIVAMPQVDSRDTDLTDLYGVDYMLVAYPAQPHLADGKQTVVTEAGDSFYQWTDFAAAFSEMYEYETVIDDMDIKLFK